MKPEQFQPVVQKIYRFSDYNMLLPESGHGFFQIDFQNYSFTATRAIFLSCGQYFELLDGQIRFKVYRFPKSLIRSKMDSRYLFKHLIALGAVDFPIESAEMVAKDNILPGNEPAVLDFSIEQWQMQNPLQSSPQEIRQIFDFKDILDQSYRRQPSSAQLLQRLNQPAVRLNQLLKKRLGVSGAQLLQNRTLLEAKREVVFSDKSMKEITYDLGFNDPAYFNRFFKRTTGKTPRQFREMFQIDDRDSFLGALFNAIEEYYKQERSTAFYARQLGMSIPAVSKKVQQKLQRTIGSLVREKLISESKQLLSKNWPVVDIAYDLGFEAPNHFSAFFKNYTGQTPSDFRHSIQKVQ